MSTFKIGEMVKYKSYGEMNEYVGKVINDRIFYYEGETKYKGYLVDFSKPDDINNPFGSKWMVFCLDDVLSSVDPKEKYAFKIGEKVVIEYSELASSWPYHKGNYPFIRPRTNGVVVGYNEPYMNGPIYYTVRVNGYQDENFKECELRGVISDEDGDE